MPELQSKRSTATSIRRMNVRIASPVPSNRSRLAILAATFTVAAALAAWFLSAVAGLPEEAVVITVMVVSFISSWMFTNTRVTDHRYHRVTLVPVRAR